MEKESRKRFFGAIGMLAAVVTIITYLLLAINAQWPFINNATIINVLLVIRTYAPLVVVALVGLEWVADKNFLVRIIFYAAIALIVVSMFFPATWTQFVGFVS